MKKIDTLVPDIYARLTSNEPFPKDAADQLSASLTKVVTDKLSEQRKPPTLRMSNLGWPDRKLWYSVNRPEWAERLSGPTRMKFLIGDVIEVVTLWLAKMAGHEVRHEQGGIEVAGVRGSIDAVVDGELVDTKSASPASFKKFDQHKLSEDDPFGYRSQLGGYLSGLPSLDDSASKERAHFLAVEKVLGKLTLDTHSAKEISPENPAALVASKRAMLEWPRPPARCYPEVTEDNGNRKLGTGCSYCPFKQRCWPGLRAFKYSKGPVFFTHVEKTPRYKGEALQELTLAQATEE